MHKKPTQTEVADFYDLTTATLRNYKKGRLGERRRYYALYDYYSRPHTDKKMSDMTKEELFELHEKLTEEITSLVEKMKIVAEFIQSKTASETVSQKRPLSANI